MNFQYERSSFAPRVGENTDQKQDHHRLTREEIQSYVAQWLRQDLNNAENAQKEKYTILQHLGDGGFGSAYRVLNREDNHEYVLKIIRCESEQQLQQTIVEMITMRLCSSPYTVRFVEFFQHDLEVYLIMEYCPEGDLAQRLRQSNTVISEDQILRWFTQLCVGLQNIHASSFLHRDIKPQNIFFGRWDVLKLGDFGLVALGGKKLEDSVQQGLAGTPGFISPEMLSGASYNSKNDVWSLGCTLYEMITRRSAYRDLYLRSGLVRARHVSKSQWKEWEESVSALEVNAGAGTGAGSMGMGMDMGVSVGTGAYTGTHMGRPQTTSNHGTGAHASSTSFPARNRDKHRIAALSRAHSATHLALTPPFTAPVPASSGTGPIAPTGTGPRAGLCVEDVSQPGMSYVEEEKQRNDDVVYGVTEDTAYAPARDHCHPHLHPYATRDTNRHAPPAFPFTLHSESSESVITADIPVHFLPKGLSPLLVYLLHVCLCINQHDRPTVTQLLELPGMRRSRLRIFEEWQLLSRVLELEHSIGYNAAERVLRQIQGSSPLLLGAANGGGGGVLGLGSSFLGLGVQQWCSDYGNHIVNACVWLWTSVTLPLHVRHDATTAYKSDFGEEGQRKADREIKGRRTREIPGLGNHAHPLRIKLFPDRQLSDAPTLASTAALTTLWLVLLLAAVGLFSGALLSLGWRYWRLVLVSAACPMLSVRAIREAQKGIRDQAVLNLKATGQMKMLGVFDAVEVEGSGEEGPRGAAKEAIENGLDRDGMGMDKSMRVSKNAGNTDGHQTVEVAVEMKKDASMAGDGVERDEEHIYVPIPTTTPAPIPVYVDTAMGAVTTSDATTMTATYSNTIANTNTTNINPITMTNAVTDANADVGSTIPTIANAHSNNVNPDINATIIAGSTSTSSPFAHTHTSTPAHVAASLCTAPSAFLPLPPAPPSPPRSPLRPLSPALSVSPTEREAADHVPEPTWRQPPIGNPEASYLGNSGYGNSETFPPRNPELLPMGNPWESSASPSPWLPTYSNDTTWRPALTFDSSTQRPSTESLASVPSMLGAGNPWLQSLSTSASAHSTQPWGRPYTQAHLHTNNYTHTHAYPDSNGISTLNMNTHHLHAAARVNANDMGTGMGAGATPLSSFLAPARPTHASQTLSLPLTPSLTLTSPSAKFSHLPYPFALLAHWISLAAMSLAPVRVSMSLFFEKVQQRMHTILPENCKGFFSTFATYAHVLLATIPYRRWLDSLSWAQMCKLWCLLCSFSWCLELLSVLAVPGHGYVSHALFGLLMLSGIAMCFWVIRNNQNTLCYGALPMSEVGEEEEEEEVEEDGHNIEGDDSGPGNDKARSHMNHPATINTGTGASRGGGKAAWSDITGTHTDNDMIAHAGMDACNCDCNCACDEHTDCSGDFTCDPDCGRCDTCENGGDCRREEDCCLCVECQKCVECTDCRHDVALHDDNIDKLTCSSMDIHPTADILSKAGDTIAAHNTTTNNDDTNDDRAAYPDLASTSASAMALGLTTLTPPLSAHTLSHNPMHALTHAHAPPLPSSQLSSPSSRRPSALPTSQHAPAPTLSPLFVSDTNTATVQTHPYTHLHSTSPSLSRSAQTLAGTTTPTPVPVSAATSASTSTSVASPLMTTRSTRARTHTLDTRRPSHSSNNSNTSNGNPTSRDSNTYIPSDIGGECNTGTGMGTSPLPVDTYTRLRSSSTRRQHQPQRQEQQPLFSTSFPSTAESLFGCSDAFCDPTHPHDSFEADRASFAQANDRNSLGHAGDRVSFVQSYSLLSLHTQPPMHSGTGTNMGVSAMTPNAMTLPPSPNYSDDSDDDSVFGPMSRDSSHPHIYHSFLRDRDRDSTAGVSGGSPMDSGRVCSRPGREISGKREARELRVYREASSGDGLFMYVDVEAGTVGGVCDDNGVEGGAGHGAVGIVDDGEGGESGIAADSDTTPMNTSALAVITSTAAAAEALEVANVADIASDTAIVRPAMVLSAVTDTAETITTIKASADVAAVSITPPISSDITGAAAHGDAAPVDAAGVGASAADIDASSAPAVAGEACAGAAEAGMNDVKAHTDSTGARLDSGTAEVAALETATIDEACTATVVLTDTNEACSTAAEADSLSRQAQTASHAALLKAEVSRALQLSDEDVYYDARWYYKTLLRKHNIHSLIREQEKEKGKEKGVKDREKEEDMDAVFSTPGRAGIGPGGKKPTRTQSRMVTTPEKNMNMTCSSSDGACIGVGAAVASGNTNTHTHAQVHAQLYTHLQRTPSRSHTYAKRTHRTPGRTDIRADMRADADKGADAFVTETNAPDYTHARACALHGSAVEDVCGVRRLDFTDENAVVHEADAVGNRISSDGATSVSGPAGQSMGMGMVNAKAQAHRCAHTHMSRHSCLQSHNHCQARAQAHTRCRHSTHTTTTLAASTAASLEGAGACAGAGNADHDGSTTSTVHSHNHNASKPTVRFAPNTHIPDTHAQPRSSTITSSSTSTSTIISPSGPYHSRPSMRSAARAYRQRALLHERLSLERIRLSLRLIHDCALSALAGVALTITVLLTISYLPTGPHPSFDWLGLPAVVAGSDNGHSGLILERAQRALDKLRGLLASGANDSMLGHLVHSILGKPLANTIESTLPGVTSLPTHAGAEIISEFLLSHQLSHSAEALPRQVPLIVVLTLHFLLFIFFLLTNSRFVSGFVKEFLRNLRVYYRRERILLEMQSAQTVASVADLTSANSNGSADADADADGNIAGVVSVGSAVGAVTTAIADPVFNREHLHLLYSKLRSRCSHVIAADAILTFLTVSWQPLLCVVSTALVFHAMCTQHIYNLAINDAIVAMMFRYLPLFMCVAMGVCACEFTTSDSYASKLVIKLLVIPVIVTFFLFVFVHSFVHSLTAFM